MTGCEKGVSFAAALTLALAACSAPPAPPPTGPQPEGTSLLGDALYAPAVDPARTAEVRKGLATSLAKLQAAPTDPVALIEYGRWLGAANRFDEAVQTFTLGLQRWPDDVRLLRFRGHREITLRRLDDAVADLTRASQLMQDQPDEQEQTIPPDPWGLDLGWLHANVWFHLALAHFLQGHFEQALDEWTTCRQVAQNDDVRVQCASWQAMAGMRAAFDARSRGDAEQATALRRRVQAALADIHSGLDVEEYDTSLELALLCKLALSPAEMLRAAQRGGTDSVEFATVGYCVANLELCGGQTGAARALLEQVCRGRAWQAFGHIAAEAELARMLGR